jgi:hypothetical protein
MRRPQRPHRASPDSSADPARATPGGLGAGGVGGQAGQVGVVGLDGDVGRQHPGDRHQPLLFGADHPAGAGPARQLPAGVDPAAAVGVDPGIDRAVQHVLQGHPVGPPPDQLPLVRPGVPPHPQLHVVVDQPAQHPMQGAELGELGEDQPHHGLGLLVGVQGRLPRGAAHIAGRQPDGQLSPPRLGLLAGQHALLEQVQLGLAHGPLQPQQQPVVELHRVVDAVGVGQQRSRQRAQLQQLVPVGARAGQPRHLDA